MCATVSRCNIYVSKDILAHDDATGTSELYDAVARSQGEDMHASRVAGIHCRGGASSQRIFGQNDSDAVCLLQGCVCVGGGGGGVLTIIGM